jgi:hypothetical protein
LNVVATRSMLARVRKLEIEKVHPTLAQMGGEMGWAAVQADVETGLAEGRYDSRDMPVVIRCLCRWVGLNRSEEADL